MKYTSAIASTGSGSLGGATASHNKGGQYFRRRAIPTNPGSALQVAVRNLVSTYSAAWANVLTGAQRAAWATYAANVDWTDSLGQTIKLSGQQMYVRSQVARVQSGLSTVAAGPTVYTLAQLTTPSATGVAATSVYTFTFNNADLWATQVGGALLVYTSRPQSVGINYFKGPYRYAGRINGAVSPPTSPQTVTGAFVGAAGAQVFWQVRAVNADGRMSAALRGSFLLT